MNADFKKLKKAHHDLMVRYVEVLNQASKLPLFVPSYPGNVFAAPDNALKSTEYKRVVPAILDIRQFGTLRFPTRLFVESHVEGKLLELSAAYLYLAETVPTDKVYVKWLNETSETCSKLAGTLVSWQSTRGIIGALLPFIITVIAATLQLKEPNEFFFNLSKLANLILILFFPLIISSWFMALSFAAKRQLFMPGYGYFDGYINKNIPPQTNKLVYRLEDDVFAIIGRGKVPELPLDNFCVSLVFFLFSGIFLLIGYSTPIEDTNVPLSAGGFAFLGFVNLLLLIGRKWT